MGKLWALLFGVTMLGCLGLFLAAPFITGWWLPEVGASHDSVIRFLYYFIFAVTGFFFVLTEALLVAFMYRYARQDDGKPPEPKASVVARVIKPITGFLNEPHKIELAWTIVPAAILLIIAFSQIGIWADVKYQSRFASFVGDKTALCVEVSARQFEWRIRYPSLKRTILFLEGKDKKDYDSFGRHAQYDDVYTVNQLHVIKKHPVLVHLGTRDVIHSFNLNPNLHIKQDALPGKIIPVWFTPLEHNFYYDHPRKKWVESKKYDIACAELCGWGHGGMVGRLFVHPDEEDFLRWLKETEAAQNTHVNDQ